ncbi:uncharacterized protein LOC126293547 [Schistocerca gregaria]|uniref:uncharacterized protein LOC126293547 n=1 Tax=Schistocerca gregaria TaxID=7010 RepID=UPI00211EC8D2|nr:uncharacterized protein LOC126293547 [Schistocerca gregaria]
MPIFLITGASSACRALHSGPAEACCAGVGPGCGNPSLVNLAELIALGDDDVRLVPLSSWDAGAQTAASTADLALRPPASSSSSSDDSISGCRFASSDLIPISSWDEQSPSADGSERSARAVGGTADSLVNLAQRVARGPRGACRPPTHGSGGMPLFGGAAARR